MPYRKRILIVEDDVIQAETMSLFLRNKGYETQPVLNGESALSMLAVHNFDLFLVDVYMPALDGIDLLNRVRACPPFKDIPVIIMTAAESKLIEGIEEQVKNKGSVKVLQKPFSMDTLMESVKESLTEIPTCS